MNINRRSILKALAAAPAAAALPVVATTATASASGDVAIASAAIMPEKYPWKWWAGYDEILHEECETREEAIAVARENGYPCVMETRRGDFNLRIDYAALHEHIWYNQNEDRVNEDGDLLHNVTKEQEKDLEQRLNAVIWQWVEAHNIDTASWMFEDIRNEENVPQHEDEEKA